MGGAPSGRPGASPSAGFDARRGKGAGVPRSSTHGGAAGRTARGAALFIGYAQSDAVEA